MRCELGHGFYLISNKCSVVLFILHFKNVSSSVGGHGAGVTPAVRQHTSEAFSNVPHVSSISCPAKNKRTAKRTREQLNETRKAWWRHTLQLNNELTQDNTNEGNQTHGFRSWFLNIVISLWSRQKFIKFRFTFGRHFVFCAVYHQRSAISNVPPTRENRQNSQCPNMV